MSQHVICSNYHSQCYLVDDRVWWLCSDDELGHLNGAESQERQKDRHRSLSKEADKTLRGSRESDPEKAPRNSRNDDAALARSVARERIRPSDGDMVSGDRVWSPQQEEASAHEKLRVREDGSARERRSRHRVDEPVLKVCFCFIKTVWRLRN